MIKLSIVIPVLLDNRVFTTIHTLGDYLNKNSIEHEFIVSGTLSKPSSLPLNVKFISTNGKKGSNLIAGVGACEGENILFIDADLPATCEDIVRLFLKSKFFDVVLGYRIFNTPKTLKKTPFSRKIRTIVFRLYVSLLFPNLQRYDTQYGLKMFKAKAIRELLKSEIGYTGLAFDVEVCTRISRSNLSVFHMKVAYTHADESVIEPISSTLELVFNA
jgi:glycosyltransferase involved in cell wall biosynthesis